MAEDTRPSLATNLDGRLHNQKAGGAFDVKKTLGDPHTGVPGGVAPGTANANGQEFQSPNGFVKKSLVGVTQMKDAQGLQSKQLSRYVRGLDNRKYSRSTPFHQS